MTDQVDAYYQIYPNCINILGWLDKFATFNHSLQQVLYNMLSLYLANHYIYTRPLTRTTTILPFSTTDPVHVEIVRLVCASALARQLFRREDLLPTQHKYRALPQTHELEPACRKAGQPCHVPLRPAQLPPVQIPHRHHCKLALRFTPSPIHLQHHNNKRFIQMMDCSILALQEVDPTKSFFNFLTEMGYQYHYRPKGIFQGILIAYKSDEFQLLDKKVVDYDEHISPTVRRESYATGHGALLLKLLFRGKHKVAIANTHLHWVPRHEKVKYHQTCSALTELNNFTKFDGPWFKFFAGDLNSLPDCNVLRLITTQQQPVDQSKYSHQTYQQILNKYWQSKNNLIKMTDVFQQRQPKFTNYTDKFQGTIDYVFYQKKSGIKVASVYELPEEEEVKKEVALPNRIFPSDHLPLICSFALKHADEEV